MEKSERHPYGPGDVVTVDRRKVYVMALIGAEDLSVVAPDGEWPFSVPYTMVSPAPMYTVDRVEIVHGLRVWTNDLERGTVDLEYLKGRGSPWADYRQTERWFYVREDRSPDSPVSQSETRVTTRWNGQKA